jgi:hypothetical protein
VVGEERRVGVGESCWEVVVSVEEVVAGLVEVGDVWVVVEMVGMVDVGMVENWVGEAVVKVVVIQVEVERQEGMGVERWEGKEVVGMVAGAGWVKVEVMG